MPIAQEVVLAGKFLDEALTKYETQIEQPDYPEYWGAEGSFHQAIGDLPFGCRGMSMARIDYTGRAVNYGGKATSLPMANFGINMDEYQCLVGVLAADWSWSELRAQEAAEDNTFLPRVNVVQEYRMAMEMGLTQWLHEKTVFGDVNAGFTGLINNPFVEVVEVSNANNGLTGTSATATTAYDFLRNQASDFRKDSRLVADATAILTSEDVRNSLTARFGDNSNDGNPLRLLTSGDQGQFRLIRALNEMNGDDVRDIGGLTTINGVSIAATDDLLLMLDTDVANNVIKHFAPMDTLPPGLLDDQLTFRQVGLVATSEVIFKKPFRARLYVLKTA